MTLGRILALQLAVPAAVSGEKLEGSAALDRSKEMMEGFSRAYGWPFVGLMVGLRALDLLRNMALAIMPPR